jgi:hypothetical protein
MGSAPQLLSQLDGGGSLPPCMILLLLCITVFQDLATLCYTYDLHSPFLKHLCFFTYGFLPTPQLAMFPFLCRKNR